MNEKWTTWFRFSPDQVSSCRYLHFVICIMFNHSNELKFEFKITWHKQTAVSSSLLILQNFLRSDFLSSSPTPNPCKSSRWDLLISKVFFFLKKEKLENFCEWNSFPVQKKGKEDGKFPLAPSPLWLTLLAYLMSPLSTPSGTSVLMHFLGSLSDWGRNWSFECVMNLGQNGKSVYLFVCLFVFLEKNRLRAFHWFTHKKKWRENLNIRIYNFPAARRSANILTTWSGMGGATGRWAPVGWNPFSSATQSTLMTVPSASTYE